MKFGTWLARGYFRMARGRTISPARRVKSRRRALAALARATMNSHRLNPDPRVWGIMVTIYYFHGGVEGR
ncbi:MAG: hypothetical protein QF577_08505 [Phycisphaerae bacterium]|nr:hypothetical protein [Phycisphaerae bacterium]MDP7637573.1 hypothetical protein [Phycisphaerae bacterium]